VRGGHSGVSCDAILAVDVRLASPSKWLAAVAITSVTGAGPRRCRAPQANAFAERWVRTARTECLDWLLIWNRRHLDKVLTVYVEHYNTARSRACW
jgi:integrase-like protein